MRNSKSKSLIIIFVFVALFIMTTGYSIYEKRLNIGGVSKIDYKNWNIHISNIVMVEADGGVDVIAPSYTNTMAKFNSRITKADGYIKYKITIKNDGTIDGVLGAINITDTENSVISYEVTGISVNDEFRAHQTKDIYVKATYDSSKVDAATTNKSNVSVNLTFVQLEGYVPQGPPRELAADLLRKTAVTTGDGLYVDPYENGNYIYRGADPNNYITFNNEDSGWRIMSVEKDGTIKIIKDTSIGQMAWDEKGTRNSMSSTYCTSASDSGCNAWAASFNLKPNSTFVQYSPNGNKNNDINVNQGYVANDASLNTYLNTTYYDGLTEAAKSKIIAHDFYVSTPGNWEDREGIAIDSQEIKDYIWRGNVALMTVPEYMKASTNPSCSSLYDCDCGPNNWLSNGISEWTLSPYADYNNEGWFIMDGGIFDTGTDNTFDVRPVIYLSSDIQLEGSGIIFDPYTIVS